MLDENQTKDFTSQDTLKVDWMRNITYILKILMKKNSLKVNFLLVYTIIRYTFNAIFWVNMPKIIFEAIEKKESFSKLFWIITFYCGAYIIFHIITVIHEQYARQTDPEFYGEINRKIMLKANVMPLHKFENPDFYDTYTKAAESSDENVAKLLEIISEFIGSAAGMVTVTTIVVGWDPIILLFALIPLLNGFFVNKVRSDLKFKQKNALVRDQRQVEYSKRIFYEREYAMDIRLHNIVGFFLNLNKKSHENMTIIQTRFARKQLFVSFWDHVVMKCIFPVTCGVYAVYQILVSGKLSIGIYLSLIVAIQNFSWQIEDMISYGGQFMVLGKEFEYLVQFLECDDIETSDIEDKADELETFQMLELKNVSFQYEGAEKPSIEKINFSLKRGEKIALVGYNGAGKSTFVKIIMGLYQPTGEVLYNLKNINEMSVASYRKKFATVFQDFQVYATSIAENVLMSDVNKREDEEKINKALKKAGIIEKIQGMDKGIDTSLTKEFDDNGTLLSGGEAQKLALARVFVNSEAEIVILDEPTSAMDPISEYKLYNSIMSATDDKTTIIISHRLSSARMADKIYMFEDGKIIEEGSHDELMALNGKYKQMFLTQARNYADIGILEDLSL